MALRAFVTPTDRASCLGRRHQSVCDCRHPLAKGEDTEHLLLAQLQPPRRPTDSSDGNREATGDDSAVRKE